MAPNHSAPRDRTIMETLMNRSPGGGHGLRNLAEFSRDPRRRTTYRDLLDRPIVVSLAMLMNEGPPQVQPVWCNFDGTHILINTEKGRQKYRNMSRRPAVTILAIDPDNALR
jgi:hypothetical protein